MTLKERKVMVDDEGLGQRLHLIPWDDASSPSGVLMTFMLGGFFERLAPEEMRAQHEIGYPLTVTQRAAAANVSAVSRG